MVRRELLKVLALTALVLIPAAAWAQSGIAGVVRDTTGAVLPGVTVEAASPALIEKVRTAVTDGRGLYNIVDLRPGVYAVTFTLPGFNAVKRDEIELPAAFTATINVEMRVGDVNETITVTGASPQVDVRNVMQREVIASDVVDVLPTGRTNQTLAAIIPGIVVRGGFRPSPQDVGGLTGERQSLSIHGGRSGDFQLYLDGLPYNIMNAGVGISGYTLDTAEIQEFTYELGAMSAETQTGGIRSNVIPKEGSNVFRGTIFANYANGGMQSDNVTDDLLARGLGVGGNKLVRIWDVNPSLGGPVKRDRLWFFGTFRYWGVDQTIAGAYWDKDPNDFVYTPDLSRPAIDDTWNWHAGLRFTWQATQKNKFHLYYGPGDSCSCHWLISATRAPEASTIQTRIRNEVLQASWSSPVTNRVLLEAGALLNRFEPDYARQPGAVLPAIQELSTGLIFRAADPSGALAYTRRQELTSAYRAALSYVTGSHAFKVGMTLQHGTMSTWQESNGDMTLQLLNGRPRAVVLWATPWTTDTNLNARFGLYAQDQWTHKRMTLNAGLRFDYHNSSIPEQHLPPAQFVPARDFAAVPDVPNWTDLSPRLGVAYDLFGNGKTALKATLSRYVAGEVVGLAKQANPVNTSVNRATRSWDDVNGDFVPQEAELGPLNPSTFGQVVIRTRYDDAVLRGFGRRGVNWETSAGVQHQLLPRVSLNAAYFRRWYGNFTVTDNLEQSPGDFDHFCVPAPVDARLPGSGQEICGLYDITPRLFGRSNNFVTFADGFGKQTEVYDGVDVGVDARLAYGARVGGGLSTGRSVTNSCFVVDSPEELRFCEIRPPFQTRVKLNGSIRLPWDLQAAATFQNLDGPALDARWVVPRALINAGLGRSVAGNATKRIDLIPPGTMFGERLNQVDVRLTKVVPVGRARIRGMLDLYNVLNGSTILTLNTTYGPRWQQPIYILPGRLLKIGAQVDF